MGGGGLWQLVSAVDVIDYDELSFGKLLGSGDASFDSWLMVAVVLACVLLSCSA